MILGQRQRAHINFRRPQPCSFGSESSAVGCGVLIELVRLVRADLPRLKHFVSDVDAQLSGIEKIPPGEKPHRSLIDSTGRQQVNRSSLEE